MNFKLKDRSLMKLTKYCLVITIPNEWINHFNLKKGDKLSCMLDNNHNLVLSPKKSPKNFTKKSLN